MLREFWRLKLSAMLAIAIALVVQLAGASSEHLFVHSWVGSHALCWLLLTSNLRLRWRFRRRVFLRLSW